MIRTLTFHQDTVFTSQFLTTVTKVSVNGFMFPAGKHTERNTFTDCVTRGVVVNQAGVAKEVKTILTKIVTFMSCKTVSTAVGWSS